MTGQSEFNTLELEIIGPKTSVWLIVFAAGELGRPATADAGRAVLPAIDQRGGAAA